MLLLGGGGCVAACLDPTTTMRWEGEAQLPSSGQLRQKFLGFKGRQAVLKIYCVDEARSLSRGIKGREKVIRARLR